MKETFSNLMRNKERSADFTRSAAKPLYSSGMPKQPASAISLRVFVLFQESAF
jgi:hypothetical protein